MNKLISITLIALLFYSCSTGQTNTVRNTNLSITEFSEKIKELPSASIIDVRTQDEYSKGHLHNAINFDWNSMEFEKQIATLDKSKPVLVYCLSGGRSSSAATKMRAIGFQEVYEMQGGIIKWRAANLPETNDTKKQSEGMSKLQFDHLLNSDKLVLVNFYADWCAPCKIMKPYLNEISTNMSSKIEVIRINADENISLCKELKIDSLPVLQLYKNNKISWEKVGFIGKEEVLKMLN
jgi:thioredoxin 1